LHLSLLSNKRKIVDILDQQDMPPERFIHFCSRIWANWGMPLTSGRVLAYLYLQSDPVAVDKIVESLEISKAGAWTAMRHLESVGQVERLGEPGSKRALFIVKGDVARSMFNYSRLMRRMGVIMEQGLDAASGPVAQERLRSRSELFIAVHEAIEETVAETLAQRKRAVSK
jgi:hypothetical protein